MCKTQQTRLLHHVVKCFKWMSASGTELVGNNSAAQPLPFAQPSGATQHYPQGSFGVDS
jgi:hypothetical protein